MDENLLSKGEGANPNQDQQRAMDREEAQDIAKKVKDIEN